ncbi:MAG: hypothetical protein M3P14_05490 [Chloroflexota bacterium]|nr:hypothetical protein [Chloroflexota bacterium]
MRTMAIVFFTALAVALVWRAMGHPLPIIDSPFGPFGMPLAPPEIRIQAPGYNVPLP